MEELATMGEAVLGRGRVNPHAADRVGRNFYRVLPGMISTRGYTLRLITVVVGLHGAPRGRSRFGMVSEDFHMLPLKYLFNQERGHRGRL